MRDLQEEIRAKISELNEHETRCAELRAELADLRNQLPKPEVVPHTYKGTAAESVYRIVSGSGERGIAFWGLREALPEFKDMNLRIAIQRLQKHGVIRTTNEGRGTLRVYLAGTGSPA